MSTELLIVLGILAVGIALIWLCERSRRRADQTVYIACRAPGATSPDPFADHLRANVIRNVGRDLGWDRETTEAMVRRITGQP